MYADDQMANLVDAHELGVKIILVKNDKYHLILPHLYEPFPEYKDFYKLKLREGSYVIQDNSTFELKDNADWELLMDGVRDKFINEIVVPERRGYHVFHLYVVRAKRRNELLKFLNENGVQCGMHYPVPLHLQDTYKDLGYEKGSFPVAEQVADEIISLPMCPMLKDEEIDIVVAKVKEFYNK